MNRREFLRGVSVKTIAVASTASSILDGRASAAPGGNAKPLAEPGARTDWLARWQKNILDSAHSRYCDKEMGEELGWLVSPFLNGFYYGYRATRDAQWLELFLDWADSCIQRGVKEPDGFIGWPKTGSGGPPAETLYSDSLLGEAMMLRPVVLMADEILKTPALEQKWGRKARGYLQLAGQTFEKWEARDCWRSVNDGGLWVVPTFGIDRQSDQWTEAYRQRKTEGFSNPANKQHHIARWLIAMHDVTRKPVYRERSEQWWRLMKTRMRTRESGKYFVWNYWDAAGPWDYKPDGSRKHWTGVHPNGGYYAIDVEGIVTAFEHGLVFGQEEIDRLIATNRDFMWSQQVTGAAFQRIDGGQPDPRWKHSPGVLWTALVPHDETLRKIFLANHNPGDWGALSATPWFLGLSTS